MGQGRERKARLPPPPNRVRGGRGRAPTPEPVAVLVGVSGARVPPDRRTARPWVCGVLAGLPRGQVACLVCVSGSGGQCRGRGAYLVAVLVLVGLPVGPCACWVPVGACWVLVCLPVARGCAGWPAWWPACWCACPWFRGSKTLKFTQRHTPEPATVPPQAGQCVPFRHIEFNVQGQQ